MEACPDDDTLVGFIEGFLSASEEVELRRHVNGCEICRSVLAASVKDVSFENAVTARMVAGRYRLDVELGRGGIGKIFRAHDLVLGHDVAIRFLDADLARDRSAVRRFDRDARSWAALKSPHTVRIAAVDRTPNGESFVVMECLKGWNLGELVERRGAFSVTDAVRYILEACDALAEAHSSGIVHGNLKPKNLFLAEDSATEGTIKVLDFGCSVVRADGGAEGDGSPTLCDWMAPEQIRARSAVDHRSDIWSLGATLYTLLCARSPFEALNAHLLRMAIVQNAQAPIARSRDDVPPSLDELVAVCLRKNPADRCTKIDAFASALRHIQRQMT